MRRMLHATGPPLLLAGWAYMVLLFTPAAASPQKTSPDTLVASPAVAFVPKTPPPLGRAVVAQASSAEPMTIYAFTFASTDTLDLCEVSCRINCRPLVALSAPSDGSSVVHLA